MSTLHEQAWNAATQRFGGDDPRVEQRRADWKDGFLAGDKAAHRERCPHARCPGGSLCCCPEAASRPRQVTTVTELDALPVGSVVLNAESVAWQKRGKSGRWYVVGHTGGSTQVPYLPARVLYVPEEES
ncbi:hypothetical protein [Cellulosimicrobium funkei]|uniref:hypothetical protein n=1 Tax=Cellulosimicrobium funkei TaxID=264251 RepID=UPI00341DFFA9